MLKWLGQARNVLTWISSTVSASLVVVMAVIVGFGALSRYLFSRPVAMVDEFSAFMLAGISFIGASYVLRENGHINVDFIIRLFRKKIAAWLAVITDVMTIATTILLLMVTWQVTLMSFRVGNRTIAALEVPLGPLQLMMPIGLLMLLVEFFYVLATSIRLALRSENPAQGKGVSPGPALPNR